MAVPVTVYAIVSALVRLPVRVKRKLPVVRPASVALASVAVTVTVWVIASSLVSVTVALLGVQTVYRLLGLYVTTTVSFSSCRVSWSGVTVLVTVLWPAGKVTLVPRLP